MKRYEETGGSGAAGEVATISWEDGSVVMIDQRRLPVEETYVVCGCWEEVGEAIRSMVIRGAPAIGVAAAMGMALAASAAADKSAEEFEEACRSAAKGLFATRPTAYNLKWALDEMERMWGWKDLAPQERAVRMEDRARQIKEEDLASCRSIGRHGADLVLGEFAVEEPVILTHCNAGALATAGYGTALGVIRAVHEREPRVRVLVDETRPFLQGARLTAWELLRENIPSELITDNMAGHFFQRGEITHVVVGADRIARNGDAANKIGTYTLSVLAREHGVPFFVAAPFSTVDFSIPDGGHIPIEERDEREVTHLGDRQIAPIGVRVRNPAFDVTPAANVTAIVTEEGVARPPYGESLKQLAAAAAGS